MQNAHLGTMHLAETPRPAAPTFTCSSVSARAARSCTSTIYDDRYQRTPEGWKFTERVYEIRSSTTACWQARRPAGRGRPMTRRAGTRLRPSPRPGPGCMFSAGVLLVRTS
jgi:hypothetical protein